MLKQHSDKLSFMRIFLDASMHWIAALSAIYYAGVRIDEISFEMWPEASLLVFVYGLSYKYFGLYGIQRVQSILLIDYNILKASIMGLLVYNIGCVLLNIPVYGREMDLFFVLDTLYLITLRMLLTLILHQMRRKGHNLRFVLIAGAGDLGQRLSARIETLAWTGLKVVGFLDDNIPRGTLVGSEHVLGTIDQVHSVIGRNAVDEIIVCLPMRAYKRIEELLESIGSELVTVRLIPDIFQYPLLLKSSAGMLGDIPIITLNDTLFHGWRRIAKRAFDVAFSTAVLILLSPVLLAISIAVKLSSPGPVFYKQERMGLDGRKFKIYKFRSMPVDAEKATGAVWAKSGEKRATPLGAFMRRTSLDELPQFLNVLSGSMSVVGPRPERPVFISQFKQAVPKYMLRHMMKAGITGWAQVNGWRGNTSLERRIDHDLYYIENWSLLLDLKIIFLTVFKGMVSRNAY